MPSSRASRSISAHICARASGSSPVVGSSRNSTCGRWMQPHGDVEPPLHAAGVGLDPPVARVGEAEALERLGDPLAQRGAGDPVELALDDEVLAAGRVAVDAVLLADDADRVADAHGLREHVVAGDAGAAGVGARERGEDPDGGGLAGAVGPEQAEDGAGLDLEVEPVERADVARVGLDEAVGLDGMM